MPLSNDLDFPNQMLPLQLPARLATRHAHFPAKPDHSLRIFAVCLKLTPPATSPASSMFQASRL